MSLRIAAGFGGVLIASCLAACSDGDETQLATGTSSATTAITQTDAKAVDFSQVPAVAEQLGASCARHPCSLGPILYEDLTGDGRDDAVVPVRGTSGMGREPVTSVFVFGFVDATLRQLLFVEDRAIPTSGGFNGPLWPYVGQGRVAISDTLFYEDEAFCCPSEAMLTVYRWDGSDFSFGSRNTVACGSVDEVFGEILCPRY